MLAGNLSDLQRMMDRLTMVSVNFTTRPRPQRSPCDPHESPAQNMGVATLSPQDLRPWIAMRKKPFPGRINYHGGGLRSMKMPQEKNGENTDLKCDLVLCRNMDSEKGGHHKIGSL